MTIFQIIAAILSFAAVGGYINTKFVRLPATIGNMAFALLISLVIICVGSIGLVNIDPVKETINSIDFSDVLLHGMLSFLLFAGALHINLDDLNAVKWPVGILATIGVVIATFITGTIVWYASTLVGIDLPYIYALLFGALISPTDPIAVLSILKESKISKKFYTMVGGESLFNDGVGIVVFLTILGAATSQEEIHASTVIRTLFQESAGGLFLGAVLGWVTYRLLRSIDEYKTEVLLTLALAAGGYALAEALHVSAPLCMVASGLFIGNHGRSKGMSEVTQGKLDGFWELIDEVLNAILFIFVGLEILIVPMSVQTIYLGGFAILATVIARFISVGAPISVMRLVKKFDRGTIRLLSWGGLRGGLSLAMALSLPAGPEKSVILVLAYIVVLFSILLQGLTFQPLIKKILRA
jgi:monovalent cation:H+ antiporter, CPA1 family